MKNFLLVVALICCLVFISSNYITDSSSNSDKSELSDTILPEIPEPAIEFKSHSKFLSALGHYESGNNYQVINKWGYLGKYQFSPSTLKSLGYKVTKEEFLTSPEIQEAAMYSLLKANKRSLRRFIRKYEGKVLHGVKVTESGVLAAAHLGGAGNVKNWFRSGEDFEDRLGTSITHYMKTFSDYSLNID